MLKIMILTIFILSFTIAIINLEWFRCALCSATVPVKKRKKKGPAVGTSGSRWEHQRFEVGSPPTFDQEDIGIGNVWEDIGMGNVWEDIGMGNVRKWN